VKMGTFGFPFFLYHLILWNPPAKV